MKNALQPALEGMGELTGDLAWRPRSLTQDRGFYWLATSKWASRASWMNWIRVLMAWRMADFLLEPRCTLEVDRTAASRWLLYQG
jgi:hypothetical protein